MLKDITKQQEYEIEVYKAREIMIKEKRIGFYKGLLQTDNSDLWATEIGAKDTNIRWNTCMVSSFAMFLLSEITISKLDNMKMLTEENIEKVYYQGLMEYLNKTPEPDHRWQAIAHVRYLNQMMDLNGHGLRWKTENSSIESIIKSIDAGHGYVFGTWATSAGHIMYAVGYNDFGLLVCDPYGDWRTGYTVQKTAGEFLYDWSGIKYLLGIDAQKHKTPAGYGRTWGSTIVF